MPQRRITVLLGNILVAVFLSFFVYVNAQGYVSSGHIGYVLIAFNESLYVFFYLFRLDAVTTSKIPLDWAVAFCATFLSTLLRPASPISSEIGTVLVAAGTLISIASVVFLNRSIAIVPALRALKTSGPYSLVRHPMYAGGIIAEIGYLIANFSAINALLVFCVSSFLVIRLGREERLLNQAQAYRHYRASTRWKLFPFIY